MKQHPLMGSPQVHFYSPYQATKWKAFYIQTTDFLEVLNTDTEVEENTKKGWKQLKMMFEGEDQQALQTLVYNRTITPDHHKTPIRVLNTIQTTTKEKEHFWHFREEILSDFRQKTDEGTHALSNHIITQVNHTKITNEQKKKKKRNT